MISSFESIEARPTAPCGLSFHGTQDLETTTLEAHLVESPR